MNLTPKQTEILNGMNPDQKEKFDRMNDSEKAELLSTLETLASDKEMILAATGDNAVEFEDVSVTGGDEKDECPILRTGGIGLTEGTVLVCMFLGSVPMFSQEKKEYWMEKKIGDKKWYFNLFFKFQTTDGKHFGIFQSPMLRILKKVYTHAATPQLVEKNPVVKIEYFGEIESKERLKEEFNFELQKGDSAHAFRVQLSKGTKVDRYAIDCVNYLKSPIPSENTNKSSKDMDELEKMKLAYERQQSLTHIEQPKQLN